MVSDHGRACHDRQVVLTHGPMLRQRLDAVQWLVSSGPLPVLPDLTPAQLCPPPNEPQPPGVKTPCKHFAVHRYRGAPTCVIGMKMRYWMILLILVHVDHDPVERANTRHDLTVSDPPGAGRSLAFLELLP